MFNAIQRVKYYAFCYALQGVNLYAHCYTRSEDFMLINVHRVKTYAHCYSACEA